MLTLSVDTSSRVGSLAVLKDQAILGVVSTSSDEAYSARMFRQVEFLLAELGIGLLAIDLYAVIAGPGSFTGLRVGLTAVKGWAEVYQRPIAPVSGLEAVASEAPVQVGLVASILDARRGQIYGALHSRSGGRIETRISDLVSAPEEFLTVLRESVSPSDVVFASPSPEIMRDALACSVFASCTLLRVSPVLAPAAGLLGIERAARGDVVTALELDANYVRRTDAEMHLKGT
jgi:tRNA threonylcarbamoyladenosine biosynthesis protein TsaB